MNQDNPLYIVYKHIVELTKSGSFTWCNHVRNILNSAGLNSLWIDHINYVSPNLIRNQLSNFGDTLRTKYKIEWENEINNPIKNPILRTYRLFKNTHSMEKYLLCTRDKRYRNALSKLRVSSHQLEIEKGRHFNPVIPESERICKFCNSGLIDNELHFITSCDFISHERHLLIRSVSEHITISYPLALDFFIELFVSRNDDVITALSKFIYISFKKRESHIVPD